MSFHQGLRSMELETRVSHPSQDIATLILDFSLRSNWYMHKYMHKAVTTPSDLTSLGMISNCISFLCSPLSVSDTCTEPVQSSLQSHGLSAKKHYNFISLTHAQIPQVTSSNITPLKLCTYFSFLPRVLHVHTLLLDWTDHRYDIL